MDKLLPKVSIIIPVKNEEETITKLLDSIFELDYPKDKMEVIIVDGKSTDKTVEKASKYPVKILFEEGKSPNNARRIGIYHASGDIYIFTDGDCVVPKDWIRRIIDDINEEEIGCVGGSVFVEKSLQDNLLAAYSDHSIMRVMPLVEEKEEISEVRVFKHLAFCNMAIKKRALERAGGLDPTLKTFEDVDVVASICKIGYKVLRDPKVYVWHKHRHTIREIIRQTYNYGRGGPKFRRKHPDTPIARFYTFGLTIFTAYFFILILSSLSGIILSNIRPVFIALIPVMSGALIEIIYYIFKTRKLIAAITYTILDILRIFAFALGDIIQTIKGI